MFILRLAPLTLLAVGAMGGVSRTFPSAANNAIGRPLRMPVTSLALISSFSTAGSLPVRFLFFCKVFSYVRTAILPLAHGQSQRLGGTPPGPHPCANFALVHQVKGLCNGSFRYSFAQNTYQQACVTASLYRNPVGFQSLSPLARRSSGS